MNSSLALMNNATGLAPNATALTALPPPPPPGLAPGGLHNTSDSLPVSTPLHPVQLTYANHHGAAEHEPMSPHQHLHHHHQHPDAPHPAHVPSLELEPCNKHDPTQLEVVLFSHQRDSYRPANDDEASPRSPTALLIGCTSRLNSGKMAYKIDPAFHSLGSRAKYANYVRKRNLQTAAVEKREKFSDDDDDASTCNSLSDRSDPRCNMGGAISTQPLLLKRMLGASPDDNVDQLKMRGDQDVSPGSLMIKRALQAAEMASKKRMAKREEVDSFIRRWASGDAQPRAFEPLDEPLLAGRDVDDNKPLETRSLDTHIGARVLKRSFGGEEHDELEERARVSTTNGGGPHRKRNIRLVKRNIGDDEQGALEERARVSTTNGARHRKRNIRLLKRNLGDDEQDALEERARVSTTNGARHRKRNIRLLKRNLVGGDVEQDALEERARVSTTNGPRHRKRGVAYDSNDEVEKRSTSHGGNNGYAGFVGRWNRRALSVGDADEDAYVQRRSLDVMPRMHFVRRSADADFDKRSGRSGGNWGGRHWRRDAKDDEELEKRSHGGSSGGGRGRRWRRDVAEDEQLEKRSHGGSGGGWGGRRWRRDVAEDEQLEKRSHGGSGGGWGGRRWRRDVNGNDMDDDAMTTRSLLSAHGDIFPRGTDGVQSAESVV